MAEGDISAMGEGLLCESDRGILVTLSGNKMHKIPHLWRWLKPTSLLLLIVSVSGNGAHQLHQEQECSQQIALRYLVWVDGKFIVFIES